MFDLFGKADYKLPKSDALWKSGPVESIGASSYRVGVTRKGETTLTLIYDGRSTTLIMNEATCKQLIRMLQATLAEEDNKGIDT